MSSLLQHTYRHKYYAAAAAACMCSLTDLCDEHSELVQVAKAVSTHSKLADHLVEPLCTHHRILGTGGGGRGEGGGERGEGRGGGGRGEGGEGGGGVY